MRISRAEEGAIEIVCRETNHLDSLSDLKLAEISANLFLTLNLL